MRTRCRHAKDYQALRSPKCGCKECADKWAKALALKVQTPLCFKSPAEYTAWKEHSRAANRTERENASRDGYCLDCTPEYQQRMIREQRCLFPQVTFTQDKDGSLVGRRHAAAQTILLRQVSA